MRAQWRLLAERFESLMLRERLLVLLAVVVGTALIFDALMLQPLEARQKRLMQQLAELRQNISTAEGLVKMQGSAVDPQAVRRSYRESLRKQLAEADRTMQGLQRGLVPPERMANLLEEMLGRTRGLQVVSLRTLPAQPFDLSGAAPGKTAKPAPREPERAIYRHSFEITLQGSYAELHDYLAQLERLPWQMFWSRLVVHTEEYPRLRVMLTVQTLSLSKAWLIV